MRVSVEGGGDFSEDSLGAVVALAPAFASAVGREGKVGLSTVAGWGFVRTRGLGERLI